MKLTGTILKGTPKAFIGYEKGKELWGSNFGPATAIRFPESLSINEINNSLTGSFDPEKIRVFYKRCQD